MPCSVNVPTVVLCDSFNVNVTILQLYCSVFFIRLQQRRRFSIRLYFNVKIKMQWNWELF